MIPIWLASIIIAYLLVAAALMLFLLPAERDERGSLLALCAFWPVWAVVIIREAADEARRNRIGK